MNQQKAGMMAQKAGQMVVPANPQQTPQPMTSNMGGPNAHSNQGGRPQQMQQQQQFMDQAQLKMDQMAAHSQAQIRAQAQAKQMHGQPGAQNNQAVVTQSPGMNTLNAPVRQGQTQLGQNNAAGLGFAGQFGNQQQAMNRQQILSQFMSTLTPEKRQQLSNMPPDKMNEILVQYVRNMQARNAVAANPQAGQPPAGTGMAPGSFVQPGNIAAPPNAAMPNQNQAALLQRMRNGAVQPGRTPPQAMTMMDSMDVPIKIMEQIRNTVSSALPTEIKKWAQLKQWMAQNNASQAVMTQLLNYQSAQFGAIMRQRQAQQQQQQPQQQPQQLQQPQQQQANMTGLATPVGPGMPAANQTALGTGVPANVIVTPQELQNAKNHEKFKGWPEDRIKQVLLHMKISAARSKAQPGQNQPAAPVAPGPQPSLMPGQGPTTAGNNITGQAQPPPSATNAAVVANTAKGGKQAPNNRSQQNQGSAPQQKNPLKRSSTDDGTEMGSVANVVSQRPGLQQQQQSQQQSAIPSGAQLGGLHNLTPQQLAAMAPESRAKYEAMMRNRQAQSVAQNSNPSQTQSQTQEDAAKLRAMGYEEFQLFANVQLQDIPMTPQEHQELGAKLQLLTVEMGRLGKALIRWYSLTRDDARARMFFKQRNRLLRQFTDEKMTTLRDTFSIRSEDVDSIRGMLESMAKDLAASFPGALKKNASQQNLSDSTTQQTALAAAQQVTPTKTHGRSASKSGQPPPPPTTAQPPFPIGAQSPAGQPTYIGKPTVTQDTLQLPAKKRAKMSGSGANSAAQSNSSSPQVPKQTSPEMVKKPTPAEVKVPAKPQFLCPHKGCDSNNIGFATEDARRQHVDEEHIKPYQDPLRFATDNLAAVLGLDTDGQLKGFTSTDGSKQSQTPTGTPTSQSPSMARQGSAAGPKSGDLIKNIAARNGPMAQSDSQSMDQPWSAATIDPQELFSSMGLLESGGGGAISDMSVYRSITPNDTPDSSASKESTVSEPNSDVSEGVSLNVTLDMGFDTWTPFGGDQYLNIDATDVDAMMHMDDQRGFANDEFADFTTWADGKLDMGKPFTIDASLYSLDTT